MRAHVVAKHWQLLLCFSRAQSVSHLLGNPQALYRHQAGRHRQEVGEQTGSSLRKATSGETRPQVTARRACGMWQATGPSQHFPTV